MYITLYEEASKSYMLYAVDPRNGATLWQLMPDTLSALTLPMVTEFSLPTAANVPESITAGSDGNLWFTETTSTTSIQQHEPQIGKIGRITPAGKISEFSLPEGTLPEEITAGADGNLWFTENQDDQAGKIGRITPTGRITEFTLPTFGSQSNEIISGPDGNLWFTEVGGDQAGKIGRIVTASIKRQEAQQNATATADAQHRADQQNAHATATQSTQSMNGTWQEEDDKSVSRWNVTQSQSSVTGDGSTDKGASVTISGSIHNQSVIIVEHITDSNCSVTYTLTVNQNNTEMDGSMHSGCNGQSYTGIVFKKT